MRANLHHTYTGVSASCSWKKRRPLGKKSTVHAVILGLVLLGTWSTFLIWILGTSLEAHWSTHYNGLVGVFGLNHIFVMTSGHGQQVLPSLISINNTLSILTNSFIWVIKIKIITTSYNDWNYKSALSCFQYCYMMRVYRYRLLAI